MNLINIFVFSSIVLFCSILLKLLFIKLKWTELYKQLHKLFIDGFGKPAPFIYFVTIIVFCGGIGIWVALFQKSYDVLNITTYVFALISSLMVDLIIVKDDSKFNDKDFMMFIIGSFIFTLTISVFAAVLDKSNFELKWFISGVSLICTWYLWWILSSCHSKFGPTQNSIRVSTIGGEPSDDVQGGGLEDLGRN